MTSNPSCLVSFEGMTCERKRTRRKVLNCETFVWLNINMNFCHHLSTFSISTLSSSAPSTTNECVCFHAIKNNLFCHHHQHPQKIIQQVREKQLLSTLKLFLSNFILFSHHVVIFNKKESLRNLRRTALHKFLANSLNHNL